MSVYFHFCLQKRHANFNVCCFPDHTKLPPTFLIAADHVTSCFLSQKMSALYKNEQKQCSACLCLDRSNCHDKHNKLYTPVRLVVYSVVSFFHDLDWTTRYQQQQTKHSKNKKKNDDPNQLLTKQVRRDWETLRSWFHWHQQTCTA